MSEARLILLTGATGYIGSRLLPQLVADGWRVRCLARQPENLRPRVPPGVEVVRGDLLDPPSLAAAMVDVHAAFYLVHSMGARGDFELHDRLAAEHFASAARAAGLQRIIYLGGLAAEEQPLSAHLCSRHQVGHILRASGVPVIEFRASIIIGSGSLSFEMIRALVERLPVMITPRWVRVVAQPIGVTDVLNYLRAALSLEISESMIIEIGGPDRLSYSELMQEYARQRGLRRWMIPVPLLTPRLSSLWLGLVTPLHARVGRKLVDSIRHPTIVRNDTALRLFPIRPIGVREAIAQALREEDSEFAQTRWADALPAPATGSRPWGGTRWRNRRIDSRAIHVAASPAHVFAAVERIGGQTGWYYADWLWRLRGRLDLWIGGVGMQRSRRDPTRLQTGDVVDCWRVEALEPGRRLRLHAEMKLPGRAWLEFEVRPDAHGTRLTQTAIFDPVGLRGLVYWYAVWPLHQLVFAGMLQGIAKAAMQQETAGPAPRMGKGDGRTLQPRGVRSAFALAGWLLLCFAAAALGSQFSPGDWYASLRKPPWNPPDWLFGPVWTALYTMMAVAAWLVWRQGGWNKQRKPLLLFLAQLVLNAAWTPLFFGLRRPDVAFAAIALLWLAIAATLLAFRPVSRAAAWLLAPYLAWVSFAAALNFTLWRLNP